MTPLTKNITRLESLPTNTIDESDDHYMNVHFTYMRRMMLRYGKDETLSYHTDRVRGQYDVTGGWHHRPTAWRFVVTRFREPLDSVGAFVPPAVRRDIGYDHTNFLINSRSVAVDEQVLHDALRGQTALDKFLFEFEATPEADVEATAEDVKQRFTTMLGDPNEVFGLRLVLFNRVIAERQRGRVREEGQAFMPDTYLPSTSKLGYIEMYFDHEEWADTFFHDRGEELWDLLRLEALAEGALYRVEERCGIDRR